MRIEKAKIRETNEDEEKINKYRVSTYADSYKIEHYNIEVNKLVPFKNQARKNFDIASLEKLAQTIKTHGIRQPLTIQSSEEHEGKYEIISGERRWRAAQIVGLLKVPCIILHNRSSAEEVALIENVQRKNLHPLELMHGLQNLLDKNICKNQQEISDKIGISRTVVAETLGLEKLPSSTQELLLKNQIKSRKILRILLKSPEANHEKIINEEKKKKVNNKLISKLPKKKERKSKIFTIYLQSESIIFEEDKQIKLTGEQKKQLIQYLQNIIKKNRN